MPLPLVGSVAAERPQHKYEPQKKTARGAAGHVGLGRRHGQRGTPLYKIWIHMRQRCHDPNYSDYHHYGGRGIGIDPAWDDFVVFKTDMGPRPTPKHSLDRIDNNGPYAAWNCRWATHIEQHNNKRNNRIIEFEGARFTLANAARFWGLRYKTLARRLEIGWNIREALTRPPRIVKP